MTSPSIKWPAPALQYLTAAQMTRIHQASLEILERIGCRVLSTRARNLLRANGSRFDDNGLCFIFSDQVEQALAQAPATVNLYNRGGQPVMPLKETNVFFGTGSDCQYLLDGRTDKPSDFSYPDVKNALRLAEALVHIDFVMGMGLAAELAPETAFQKKYAAMLSHTTKPQVIISGPELATLEDIIQMAACLRGSVADLAAAPLFALLVDPTSPLVHSRQAADKLMLMAKYRLPVIYGPGILAGGTGPVTLAGVMAQANAEILAGLVMHQLTSPGAPFIYGAGMSPMDMQSGQPTYSAPEAMMTQAGLCQMGRERYHLPTWGFGGCSAAKLCDAQAVNEAATTLLTAAWAGTNLVHDIGYIDFGMTYSYELVVLCDEFVGQIRRMMDGIVVDDEQLALEAIRRVGPGGDFLSDAHTFAHFKQNWQPELTDRRTRSQWQEKGGRTMAARARMKIQDILTHFEVEPLPVATQKDLSRILQR